jgi:hypothetical protein
VYAWWLCDQGGPGRAGSGAGLHGALGDGGEVTGRRSGGARRFPPPWDIEEHNQSCYIVRDGNGQALAYVYFEAEAGEGPQRDC